MLGQGQEEKDGKSTGEEIGQRDEGQRITEEEKGQKDTVQEDTKRTSTGQVNGEA